MSINDFRFRSVNDFEHEKFDRYSRSVSVIQEPHRLSHEGMVFHSSGKVLSLVTGGIEDMMLTVPAGAFPHLQRWSITVDAGGVDLRIYENPTATNDGTPQAIFNTNRNSANAPLTVVNFFPTLTDLGTLMHTTWIPPQGTGVGKNMGVVNVTNGEEWLLADDSKYLFRLQNESGTTIDYRFEFVWYEVQWQNAGK